MTKLPNADPPSGQLFLAVTPGSRLFLKPDSPTRFTLAAATNPLVVGRVDGADVFVNSEQVSRLHASLKFDGTSWFITDTGSKLGTLLNHRKLPAHVSFHLNDGDHLKLGPVELVVRSKSPESHADSSLLYQTIYSPDDSQASSIVAADLNGSVSVLKGNSLGGLAQQRLQLLLKSAARFSTATNVTSLGDSLTEAAAQGTSAPRALLFDVSTSDWRVCGSYPSGIERGGGLTVSRSLIRATSKGDPAILDFGNLAWSDAASIQNLKIQSAICVPLIVDESVQAALYLDARDSERQMTSDAAAYCLALAQLAGMALANLRRAELAARERAMQAELREARDAQKNLMPPNTGLASGLRYALECLPGTIVAGDLFDVVSLDEHRTLVMLGDVMGKGAGAGFVMATVQTYLTTKAGELNDLPKLVDSANRHFFQRLKGGCFVTLWIGIFDRRDLTVEFIDAGHGHWGQLRDGEFRIIESIGGPPLGMIQNTTYASERLTLEPSNRILLYSDGLVEQVNAAGALFGSLHKFEDLAPEQSPLEDVRSLLQRHEAFRGSEELNDDLTIASIQFYE